MTARPLSYALMTLGAILHIGGSVRAQNTQLTISNQTYFTVASGCGLVLRNTDVRADGVLAGPDSFLFLYGDSDQAVYSRSPVGVGNLWLSKRVGSRVVLNGDVQASGLVFFGGGDLDLNGYDLILSGSGLLNENDSSRITGLNGGSVVTSLAGVDAPNALNPGHLGAVITSSGDPGDLTIRRFQKPFLSGQASSIQRSYLIEPQHNSGLGASFRFYYLDADLNGEDPATLTLWRSDDGITWTGYTPDTLSHAAQLQFAGKSGIDSFSYWTLSDAANPLAALSGFSALCQDNYALLRWRSAGGRVEHFEVERSPDRSTWTFLQNVPGANVGGAGGSEYTYKDYSPQNVAYYRIKVVGYSGAAQYSPVFSGGCDDLAFPMTVNPNPATDQATLRLGLRENAEGVLQVLNAAGGILFARDWRLTTGINQITIPLSGLAPGIYFVWVRTKHANYRTRIIKK